MKICSNCGLENSSNANFCKFCGARFAIAEDMSYFKGNSPEKLSDDKSNEGKQINAAIPEKKKGSKKIVIFLLAFIVLAVVLLGIFFLKEKLTENKSDEAIHENEVIEVDEEEDPINQPEDSIEISAEENGENNTSKSSFFEKIDTIRKYYYDFSENPTEYKMTGEKNLYDIYRDSNGVIRRIALYPSENEGRDYSQDNYYNENEEVIFIFVSHNDGDKVKEKRFYFWDNCLIRQIDEYGSEKDFDSGLTYDDICANEEIDSMLRDYWPKAEQEIAMQHETSGGEGVTVQDSLEYFIENSNGIYFSEGDLAGFDADDLRLARNGIYARAGRGFRDETLQKYFEKFEWYSPLYAPDDFSESLLNEYSSANLELVVAYEKKLPTQRTDDLSYDENIEPNFLSGYYEDERNSKNYFSLSMYTDYVEPGFEVGNFESHIENGFIYWNGGNEFEMIFDNGQKADMKAYQRNGEIVFEISGDSIGTGVYVRLVEYVS